MSVLDDLKDLLIPGAEEDLPPSEQIAARREEVRDEIERLEDELRALRSDEGRREALAEADSPEELGRRKRLLEDRLAGLKDLDSELVARQRQAKNEEMRRDLRETVARLPDLADELEAAIAAQEKARSRFESALSKVGDVKTSLDHREGAELDVTLPDAHLDRVERLAERVSGTYGYALDALRPAEDEEGPDRFVREDMQHQIRYFVGDWSGVDWREAVPPAPAGWTNDFSRAEGVAEQ